MPLKKAEAQKSHRGLRRGMDGVGTQVCWLQGTIANLLLGGLSGARFPCL